MTREDSSAARRPSGASVSYRCWRGCRRGSIDWRQQHKSRNGFHDKSDEQPSRLLSTACLESLDPTSERPSEQHQRRLRPDERSQLKSEYLSGVEVKELAQRFGITRQTVIECMRRQGGPRRYPKLGQEAIDKAASLYRAGWSLVAVGGALSVDPSTVRRVLITQGVPMRDPHGRERRE